MRLQQTLLPDACRIFTFRLTVELRLQQTILPDACRIFTLRLCLRLTVVANSRDRALRVNASKRLHLGRELTQGCFKVVRTQNLVFAFLVRVLLPYQLLLRRVRQHLLVLRRHAAEGLRGLPDHLCALPREQVFAAGNELHAALQQRAKKVLLRNRLALVGRDEVFVGIKKASHYDLPLTKRPRRRLKKRRYRRQHPCQQHCPQHHPCRPRH